MPTDPERLAIDHVAQRLSRQFATLDTDLVARVVWDTYRHFDAHPTRDVVPILVQDAARDRLRVIPTASSRPPRPDRTAALIGPWPGQSGSARPMLISVTSARMAARNATMSSRSGSSGLTAGNCSASNSSSPISPRRRSGVARRQLPARCSYLARTAETFTGHTTRGSKSHRSRVAGTVPRAITGR